MQKCKKQIQSNKRTEHHFTHQIYPASKELVKHYQKSVSEVRTFLRELKKKLRVEITIHVPAF